MLERHARTRFKIVFLLMIDAEIKPAVIWKILYVASQHYICSEGIGRSAKKMKVGAVNLRSLILENKIARNFIIFLLFGISQNATNVKNRI